MSKGMMTTRQIIDEMWELIRFPGDTSDDKQTHDSASSEAALESMRDEGLNEAAVESLQKLVYTKADLVSLFDLNRIFASMRGRQNAAAELLRAVKRGDVTDELIERAERALRVFSPEVCPGCRCMHEYETPPKFCCLCFVPVTKHVLARQV